MSPVTEIELTRSASGRRLYALGDIGTLRLEGFFASSATANAGSESWHFARVGFWRRTLQATDLAGSIVGEFNRREWRRGGAIEWGGRTYGLRPTSVLRQRYALTDDEDELALIDARGWGKRPVGLTVVRALDPGLLLFAAFVSDTLAKEASSTAGGGASAGALGA
jgi:hypothetical protein